MFAREFFLGVIATREGSTHKDVYTNVPLAIYMDVLYCLTKVGHLRDCRCLYLLKTPCVNGVAGQGRGVLREVC